MNIWYRTPDAENEFRNEIGHGGILRPVIDIVNVAIEDVTEHRVATFSNTGTMRIYDILPLPKDPDELYSRTIIEPGLLVPASSRSLLDVATGGDSKNFLSIAGILFRTRLSEHDIRRIESTGEESDAKDETKR